MNQAYASQRMPAQLTVYRVFLSSPSDVAAEREHALQVQDRVNSAFALPRRRLLHVGVWEHLVPRFGRTQDRLNLLVDECDLFVGLLYKRWGTPTGDFSSGFEEEFVRAEQRRLETRRPEIAVFFKTLTDADEAAGGEDLDRIRQFKESVSQKLTYRPIRDLAQWENELTILFTNLVIGDSETAPNVDVAVAAANDSGVGLKAHDDDGVRRRLADSISALPELEKITLTLYYYEGLTLDEVAEVLGKSSPDVETIYRNALLALRGELMSGDVGAVRRLWEELG